MTDLIAIVGSAADVSTAVEGGVRRVVVRPGRADPGAVTLLAAVANAARNRCAVSLWWPDDKAGAAEAVSACGADEIWSSSGKGAPSGVAHWAVLRSADGAGPAGAVARGCTGLVIGSEGPARLLQTSPIGHLDLQARQGRGLGLGVRIFGPMEAPDVPRLLALAPDALVCGDLLRHDGTADGLLAPERVRLVSDLLQQVAPVQGGAGSPVPSADPDRIFVRDWTVSLHLGAYGHEHAAQRVRFTVEADVARRPGRASDMRDVVTYDLITDAIARATVGHVALVETIAEDVAALVLAHPRVEAVDITVEKLDLGPGSLGCRIRRRRAS